MNIATVHTDAHHTNGVPHTGRRATQEDKELIVALLDTLRSQLQTLNFERTRQSYIAGCVKDTEASIQETITELQAYGLTEHQLNIAVNA